MGKTGRPGPTLDDYLYWQERLEGRGASGLSIDEFCLDEGVSRSTFYRWIRRIQEGTPESVKEEGEAPVGRLGGSEVLAGDPDGITRGD